jgi:hypothetical protein
MKFDRYKTFPYPVLRPHSDDYVDAEFQALAEFEIQESKIHVRCSYRTSSNELQQQIALGFAKYISIVSCRETYFRYIFNTDKEIAEEDFNAESLRGEVLIESYIVAVKKINNYGSPDINPEFGKKRFNFNLGEILAQDETQAVYFDRDLFKPISSIFELVKNESLSGGEWRIGLESNNVQIEVSPAMKESIDASRNSTPCKAILINSLYYSAVVHAIQRLKDGNECEDFKWVRVFEQQIHNFHIDLSSTDAYIIAQKLMKHPLGVLKAHVFSN